MNSDDQIPFSEMQQKFFAIRVRWKRADNGHFVGPIRFLCGVRRSGRLNKNPLIRLIRKFKTKGAANRCRKLEAVQCAHSYLFWDSEADHVCNPNSTHCCFRDDEWWERHDNRMVPIHAVIEVVEVERVTTTRIEAVITDEPVLDRLAAI